MKRHSKFWFIVCGLFFLGGLGLMIAGIISEKGFHTWAGIGLGISALALLPVLLVFLMQIATEDDRILKPSEKDKEENQKKHKK